MVHTQNSVRYIFVPLQANQFFPLYTHVACRVRKKRYEIAKMKKLFIVDIALNSQTRKKSVGKFPKRKRKKNRQW